MNFSIYNIYLRSLTLCSHNSLTDMIGCYEKEVCLFLAIIKLLDLDGPFHAATAVIIFLRSNSDGYFHTLENTSVFVRIRQERSADETHRKSLIFPIHIPHRHVIFW